MSESAPAMGLPDPAAGTGRLVAAVGLSVLVHAGALAGLGLALRPEAWQAPPPPPPKVEVRSLPVERVAARPDTPDAAATAAAPAGGRPVGTLALPPAMRLRAEGAQAPATAARPPAATRPEAAAAPVALLPVPGAIAQAPAASRTAVLSAGATDSAAMVSVTPGGGALPAARPGEPVLAPDQVAAPATLAVSARGPGLAAVAALAERPAATADAAAQAAAPPPAESLRQPQATAPPARPAPASGPASPPDRLPADKAGPAPATTPLAGPSALPAERHQAALAPPGSLALPAEALAAFLRPGDPAASGADLDEARDSLAAALASLPCSRIQSSFNPDTGTLDLRGHVPDPALRPVVMEMLSGMLGPGVPVAGDLLVLPRPQCQVLAAIDALGLPQSSDQYSDPRVIGPDAHVRDYRFAEGDRLLLELEAPDYPAWVQVDYFDASGQVLHLQPNEMIPPARILPGAAIRVGDGALSITIAPPFGQEIAVAFATSAPLNDGTRPMVEPAGPYLAEMAERLRTARATDPGFKGEWVYFFVTTAPR